MARQTKMVIITSNEDLIRKFSLNKSINTQIIELNDDKQVISMVQNDNNIINLALLGELTEHNSKSDHIYKRVLDSPHYNRTKQVKLSKKKTDLICNICGDQAIGFNYDVLSCASCKAFFRRNAAHQHSTKINCLTGHGHCSVSHETHRKCQRCRLDRCFAVGMRKDFIVSEEEKQERKKRLEENRNMSSKRSSTSEFTDWPQLSSNSESLSETLDNIDHLLMNVDEEDENIFLQTSDVLNEMNDISLETLPNEDWITIQSIRSSFLSILQNEIFPCSSIDVSTHTTALISWSQMANQIALKLISFFRQIDEFENLHADDRFILIKFNLLCVFPIFKCFSYQLINDCCSFDNNEEAEKHRRFFILCGDSNGIRDSFVNLVLLLVKVTEQDATLISLLLAILIFSQGLSMNEHEPPLKDALAVYRAQSHYIKLLWNYFIHKWDEVQACKQFTQLLTIILRIQSESKRVRDFFRSQFLTSNTVDKMAPLMQTVLHIS